MNQLEYLYSEELYKIKPKVVVIIPRPWEQLRDDETALLSKILGAVRLSLPAVQVISKKEFSLRELKPLNPSHIISFGAPFQDSPDMYEPLVSNIPVVVAHELRDLDDGRKKSLWSALRQIFHG